MLIILRGPLVVGRSWLTISHNVVCDDCDVIDCGRIVVGDVTTIDITRFTRLLNIALIIRLTRFFGLRFRLLIVRTVTAILFICLLV